jgi:thioredoxin reductase (NADPH)
MTTEPVLQSSCPPMEGIRLIVHRWDPHTYQSHYLIEEIAASPTIRVLTSTHVTEVKGDTSLEAITIANTERGETRELPTTALFVLIGAEPHTEWLAGTVARDAQGYILSGSDLAARGTPPTWVDA